MKTLLPVLIALALIITGHAPALGAEPLVSEASQSCLECHVSATPGIVADWKRGRMARFTPAQALKKPPAQRRISATEIPAKLMNHVVGCAECHTLNPEKHPGSFKHEDYKVHTVVSPRDCAVCHPVEVEEYSGNLMSRARVNMVKNPLYRDMAHHINGVQRVQGAHIEVTPADSLNAAESCFYCHGTRVKVIGKETRDTGEYGEMNFVKLSGWPNRGVGRINPDGSLGSCTGCHTRHQYPIQMARQPATCSQCHRGPDVPAYKVFNVSKHGNLYTAMRSEWNFIRVPWIVGEDFSGPTCAACHISLLHDAEGNTVVKRSHRMADRLWVRLLGLIYSHPHPKSPDTSIILNANGLNLPTTLDGKMAAGFLIGAQEQQKRKAEMSKVCYACHSTQWTEGQFKRVDAAIKSSDAMVGAATRILLQAWREGHAAGPAQKASPFDEYIERIWVEQWLFYANSVRLASAMMGADLGVFENGRWQQAMTVRRMHDWLKTKRAVKK